MTTSSTTLRASTIAALALTLAIGPRPALAEPATETTGTDASGDETTGSAQQEAAALRKRAEERYFADDHAGALADFARAWELAPHPTDLFNMGRIHEEMGDLEDAVARYEQFVEQPRIPLEERKLVAERLEVLRVLVAKQQPAAAPPPLPRMDAAGRDAMSDGGAEDRRMRQTRPLVASGASLLGLGAAIAIAGGLGFGLTARRASDRVDALGNGRNPERLDLTEAENLDARGKDLEALQIASLATGGVMIAIGAALLGTGLARRRAGVRHSVSAAVSARSVGVTTRWRF